VAYKRQTKAKKDTSKSSLKEWMKLKQTKITKTRAVLGMLNTELARHKGKHPPTKRQKRNIETKLQGTTHDQLRGRIA